MNDEIESLKAQLAEATKQNHVLRDALEGVMPDGLEDCCDECGGDPEKCFAGCPYPVARQALSASFTEKGLIP